MEWINKIFFKNFESLYKSLTLEFGFYTAKLSKSGTQTKICFSHIIEKRNSVFLQCYCSKFLTVRHILYILKGVFTNHLAYICLLFYIKSTFRKNITYRARILPDYICRKVIFETCQVVFRDVPNLTSLLLNIVEKTEIKRDYMRCSRLYYYQ